MSKLSYQAAGVDLEKYQESMSRLPKLMERTRTPRALNWAGGFAGLFELDFQNPLFARNYKQPVLVSGTDGVGTKLKVAQMASRHDTVGIDLVAMCVNDVICCGAEPLFFLDYVAMSKDDSELLEQIVTGISEGCVQSGAALLGGETAIMPDIYNGDDYDLAGFCVGVVEKENVIDGKTIQANDVMIGIGSSGFHSNGYSLIRKVVFEHAGLSYTDTACDQTVGELLLRPTKIYAKLVRDFVGDEQFKNQVRGIAHITGGGLDENVTRILPEHLQFQLDESSWTVPPEFQWLQQLGDIDKAEMFRVFNMGVGMVFIVNPSVKDQAMSKLSELGESPFELGSIVAK